jgi:enoyl-CoA hydratase
VWFSLGENHEKVYRFPNFLPRSTGRGQLGATFFAESRMQFGGSTNFYRKSGFDRHSLRNCSRLTVSPSGAESPMDLENLRYELRPPLAVVTLDRPKVLNALNHRSMTELEQVFLDIQSNDAVRAVLITGAGEKAFVAGADIRELASLSALEGEQAATRGQRIFNLIENCGKPVIACINGFALGGGCELALACTLRIASTNARLGQPEVKIGIIPGYGGTQRLPRLIGKGAALKMILTGEVITAAEAWRLGLVDEVVEPDRLLARAEQLAQTIAAVAPLAIRGSMRAVNSGYDLPLASGLELEASLFGLSCSTSDKAEGTAAFLEKRAAAWAGK